MTRVNPLEIRRNLSIESYVTAKQHLDLIKSFFIDDLQYLFHLDKYVRLVSGLLPSSPSFIIHPLWTTITSVTTRIERQEDIMTASHKNKNNANSIKLFRPT